jgi:hypothetical protein
MEHAKHLAGLLALLAGLGVGDASAQQAQKSAQAAQEQRDGRPQAQEEQAGNAAQQPVRKPGEQPVAGQPQGKPDDKATKQKSENEKTAKPPVRRRSVQANIGTMPQPTAPQSYGTVLHDMAPQTTMPAPAPGGLPPPAAINNCVGGQCTDASGNTYNTGTGNAALDSKGRLCTRNGQTMQCF